ncbi:MAG: NUDIX hydrolase [Pseudomonadota bacterium]
MSSRTVYRGKLLHVTEDKVRLPDGKTAIREYIKHPGVVMIIALPDEETLILERQFRYPLKRHFIELPAGKIDAGEESLAAAKRELIEECGYEAKDWRHLATLHPCIGYADERIELFLARDLVHVGRKPDDGESLEVLPVKIAEALEWVRAGRITEIKAVIGLLWLEKILRQEWA